jgi:hypothetical protein
MPLPEQEAILTEGSPRHQRELQNLQRLAMVGTLASGLGHDLRNVVMPVLLRLDVLGASPDIPESARADLAAIRQSVLHLQRLAAGLRLLSSDPRQRSEVQFARLDEWWADVCPLVIDALASHTVLEHAVPSDLPTVAVPPSVLAQVVMNLAMNARRAMEEVERPCMRIRAQLRGERVLLEVHDNGTGMDAETRDRCFEPYFTTRPREVATGLGLSTGRALLHDFGADVRIVDSTDDGSTFEVSLPIHRDGEAVSNGSHPRLVHLAISDPRQRAVVRLLLAQQGLQEWRAVAARDDEPLGGHGAPPDVVIGDAEGIDAYRRRIDTEQPAPPTRRGARAPQLIGIGQDAAAPVRADGTQWIDPRDLSTVVARLR